MATVRHISDTAKWVAAFRALETARPDALFRDPYAERLAGNLGRQLARDLPGGHGNAWSLIVRTKLLDDLIERVVRDEKIDTVLNLAAGFDSRPYRLAVPAELRWIEVDLPALLAEKTALLADAEPRCCLARVPLDLADRPARQHCFASVVTVRTLVVTEGLLMYLSAAQNGDLADDLAAVPTFRLWALDLFNHRVLKLVQRQWNPTFAKGGSEMKFGPKERLAFFRPNGWQERESHSMLEAGVRLGRRPLLGGFGQRVMHALPSWIQDDLPWAGVGLLTRR